MHILQQVYQQEPPARRASSGFVGLENQGATCYLNSLIQALYMTPEMRMGLYSVDPQTLGVDSLGEYEEVPSIPTTSQQRQQV